MHNKSIHWRYTWMLRNLACACLLLLSACQTSAPELPEHKPEISNAPTVEVQVKKPAPVKPSLAIVVSSKIAAYTEVQGALTELLSRPYKVFNLEENEANSVNQSMKEFRIDSIVAIGEPALNFVEENYPDTETIYAQIFSPVNGQPRGVAAIPPMQIQLEFWKSLNPQLKNIGVVSSEDFKPFVRDLVEAGKHIGINVIEREVNSDKAALHEFRRLVPVIEGFVMLPDAKILSPNTIRRIITHSDANEIQLLVYNLPIFQLGAFLYIAADTKDVAQQIITLLKDRSTRSRELTKLRIIVRGSEQYINVSG